MSKNNKQNVYQVYDKIVDWFDEHRSRNLMERPYLDLVVQQLNPGASILDIGCGMGEPIAQFFIEQGFALTGVDGSQKMIDLAQCRFAGHRFIASDMRQLNLGEKFDAIISWHCLFHLPPEDQRRMFPLIEAHLKPGGIFVMTTGSEAGEIWGSNGGEALYHASLSLKEYQDLLQAHHFEVIKHCAMDPACGNATPWVAKYRG